MSCLKLCFPSRLTKRFCRRVVSFCDVSIRRQLVPSTRHSVVELRDGLSKALASRPSLRTRSVMIALTLIEGPHSRLHCIAPPRFCIFCPLSYPGYLSLSSQCAQSCAFVSIGSLNNSETRAIPCRCKVVFILIDLGWRRCERLT